MSFYFQKLAIIAMTFALISCASKSKQVRHEQAMLHFGAGTQSLITQDYTDALTNMLKADELEPENADILTNLGMAYYFKGQTDIAVKVLKRAIGLNENQSDAKLNLASIFYKEGDVAGAEKLYKSVLSDLTYDKQARTYYNLGILEIEKRKNSDAAEKYFKAAIKEDENYCQAFQQLGLIQYGKAMYKTAADTFRTGTRGVCIENAPNYYYHALTLVELRQYEKARMRFDEIDARFHEKFPQYASLAREKQRELTKMVTPHTAPDTHANNKHKIESPEF